MPTRQNITLSVLALLPFALPVTLATLAENTPRSEQTCEMFKDIDFSGYDVTVKRCKAYGFETYLKIWRDQDAPVVCISNDPIRIRYYADEEDEFDLVECAAVESSR